ncbi:Bax inhibitor-1 family protein [Allocoprobacillus halotolerans]|uniref:Bax inhibitor-1 family protein n=1 Tax=Allocoprobacillus halotolerans TaxID=2944914 RepID=A0ABY5I517_9FIRM|nr:Bax inhibitor-1 family protein [Allocoprobacillus halotolerans]UTY40448.1 Bax inhibitor-1 family protein [Allocoprobacillus halotolerans]
MDQRMLTEQMNYENFLAKVIKWVCIGVAITAITSFIVILSGIIRIIASFYLPILFISVIVELLFVWRIAKKLEDSGNEVSYSSAKKYFILYSMMNGVVFSFVLSSVSIYVTALAFALTCAYFGLLYTITKYTSSNFSFVAKVCVSFLPILIIGYIILMFIHAPVLYYIIVLIDLGVFTGLTLYDLKNISTMYQQSLEEQREGLALICALELYLDFVNIFLDILMLISDNN